MVMNHLVLLGDSIFDNAAYVAGAPTVIDQVQMKLPAGWQVTLLAVDGSLTCDVLKQIDRLPGSVTHLVLSVGGNDALGALALLYSPAPLPMMNALSMLAAVQHKFEAEYLQVITALMAIGKPLLICTIYDKVPGLTPELRSALGFFNDVIIRSGVVNGIPVLDLRAVCTDEADYSILSPIEPSTVGGDKIAAQIARVVREHSFKTAVCSIYR
jgi:hypothetical protein